MRMRLGTRLAVTFTILAVFVVIGSAIAIVELRRIWSEGERLSRVDAQVIAVLRVNNRMLQLQQRLQRAAAGKDRAAFQELIKKSRAAFLFDTSRAKELLRQAPLPDHERALRTLETIEWSISSQMTTLAALAEGEDWSAIDRRLQEQFPALSALSDELVQEIVVLGRAAQEEAAGAIRKAMSQAIGTVVITAVLLLIAAFFLGRQATQDIGGPIEQLRQAAAALAKGEAVQIEKDANQVELAELGDTFQEMADRVRGSYLRLQQSEALFRALTENASDVVLLVDGYGRVKYASPSAKRLLTHPARALEGSQLFEIVEPADRMLAEDLVTRCRNRLPTPGSSELHFLTVDTAPRIVEVVVTNLLNDEAVRGIVFNGRDITERRAAEEALRQSESHLKQAQKMETVGRLAGGIAHDFNNLIGVIKGYTQLIQMKMPPSTPVREYTEQIDKATKQAADLTRQLLAFTRKQGPSKDTVDVAAVLRESGDLLQRLLGEDIELAIVTPATPLNIKIDPTQLQQVIINLCINARDAMPKGGTLKIAVVREQLDSSMVTRLGLNPAGEFAHLSVEDSGSGMPEDVLPHIFEPFFTTKQPDKGTGLGLFMVYGIVRQAGGTILAANRLDRPGSIFSLYFPEAASTGGEKEVVAQGLGTSVGHARVLLVEDNDMLRQMVDSYLSSCGYEVTAVSRPDQALRAISTTGAGYQLLVTDIIMPQMHGSDLAIQIRRSHPEIQVLFISGYAPEGEHNTSGVPGSQFIQKPFALQELSAKVSALLNPNATPAQATVETGNKELELRGGHAKPSSLS
jgi:two-component system, cell cycle sensor histidine kinase and response regulator CckA